jgi:hypothetical protein
MTPNEGLTSCGIDDAVFATVATISAGSLHYLLCFTSDYFLSLPAAVEAVWTQRLR